MITAIVIFFASIIGIMVFMLILFSILRRRQLKRNSNQHHFSSYSIIHTSSDSPVDSWSYNSNSDSSGTDSGWSSCSGSDSGGSSCGGGCGGGGD